MKGKISNFQQIASLRRYTITEGAEKGLDVIDCDNGKIRFLVNVSKACDIMQVYHEGQNLSFISKNGFTKRETPFINRFEGGMLYTCGLDSVGARTGYELHGTLHNIPAQIVQAECNEKGIFIQAIIRDSALFGKNLVLKRKIFSSVQSQSITLEDSLVNEGFNDENYCLLYHVNLGYPMLDEGCDIIANVNSCTSRTEWAEQNKQSAYKIDAPIIGQEETCYFLNLNKPEISLVNSKINKRFTLSYSSQTLTNFVEWKSMASGDYALGFEPCTTLLDDKFEYKKIKANEQINFWVTLSIEKTSGN